MIQTPTLIHSFPIIFTGLYTLVTWVVDWDSTQFSSTWLNRITLDFFADVQTISTQAPIMDTEMEITIQKDPASNPPTIGPYTVSTASPIIRLTEISNDGSVGQHIQIKFKGSDPDGRVTRFTSLGDPPGSSWTTSNGGCNPCGSSNGAASYSEWGWCVDMNEWSIY